MSITNYIEENKKNKENKTDIVFDKIEKIALSSINAFIIASAFSSDSKYLKNISDFILPRTTSYQTISLPFIELNNKHYKILSFLISKGICYYPDKIINSYSFEKDVPVFTKIYSRIAKFIILLFCIFATIYMVEEQTIYRFFTNNKILLIQALFSYNFNTNPSELLKYSMSFETIRERFNILSNKSLINPKNNNEALELIRDIFDQIVSINNSENNSNSKLIVEFVNSLKEIYDGKNYFVSLLNYKNVEIELDISQNNIIDIENLLKEFIQDSKKRGIIDDNSREMIIVDKNFVEESQESSLKLGMIGNFMNNVGTSINSLAKVLLNKKNSYEIEQEMIMRKKLELSTVSRRIGNVLVNDIKGLYEKVDMERERLDNNMKEMTKIYTSTPLLVVVSLLTFSLLVVNKYKSNKITSLNIIVMFIIISMLFL
jgi:hypothetical protein